MGLCSILVLLIRITKDSLVPRPRFPTAADGLHHRYVASSGDIIWNAVCCKNRTRARSLLSVVNLITIACESTYSSTCD